MIGAGSFVDNENLFVYKTSGAPDATNLLLRHDKTVAGGFNYGIENRFDVSVTSGTTDSVQGFFNYVNNSNLGTINFVEAFTQRIDNLGTGTIIDAANIKIFTPTNNGTIDNLYGIYIENQTGATTNYSIYSDGGDMFHQGTIIQGTGYLSVNNDNSIAAVGIANGDILSGSSESTFQYDSNGNIYFDRANDTPTTTAQMFFRRARGTQSSLSNTSAGDDVGRLRFYSRSGGVYDEVASIIVDTFTNNDAGTIRFLTALTGAALVERMRIEANGYVGLGNTSPTHRLYLPTTASAAGQGIANAWQLHSDLAYKEDVRPLEDGLEKILQLRGVVYKWKDSEDRNDIAGVIAQEVKEVLPNLVSGEEGSYGVDYIKMIPYLIEAVKEQQVIIDTLKSEVEILKGQING